MWSRGSTVYTLSSNKIITFGEGWSSSYILGNTLIHRKDWRHSSVHFNSHIKVVVYDRMDFIRDSYLHYEPARTQAQYNSHDNPCSTVLHMHLSCYYYYLERLLCPSGPNRFLKMEMGGVRFLRIDPHHTDKKITFKHAFAISFFNLINTSHNLTAFQLYVVPFRYALPR